MAQVVARMTRSEARELLHRLPAVLSGRASDPTGLVRELQLRLGVAALSLVRQAYVEKAQGAADESGLRWPPLSPATLARKGRDAQILRGEGPLFDSLSPGHPQNVLDATPGGPVVGTSVPYAKAHHEGVPGRLPRRRLWPEPGSWPASWRRRLAEVLRDGAAQLARALLGGA